jgi:hypothetical protein
MGFFDGSQGFTTSNGTTAPWDQQQPYLNKAFQRTDDLYNQGPFQYHGGLAGIDPRQSQALNMQTARAANGSPVMQGADSLATDTLNGNFLSSGNPYFAGMVGQLGQQIAPQVQGYFAQNGRSIGGNGAAPQAFASALSDAAGKLAYQNYSDERANQLKTSLLAPTFANQDYTDIGQLYGAGAQQRALGQEYIDEGNKQANYEQLAPWDLLGRYSQGISGNYGSQTSQQVPYYQPSGASQALGAGLGIAGIGSLLGGSAGGMAGLSNLGSTIWNGASSAAKGIGGLLGF